jgi:hypothetical protein
MEFHTAGMSFHTKNRGSAMGAAAAMVQRIMNGERASLSARQAVAPGTAA